MFTPLALAAVLLEALFGYPKWLSRHAGHPVMWLGSLIAWCDTHLNIPNRSDTTRRLLGVFTLVIVVATAAGTAALLSILATELLGGTFAATAISFLLIALAASTLIAQRSLYEHVENVANALENDGLESGRKAVSQIVGRDTSQLDEADVARAAIESLAENFSDGVVTPVFWLALSGLPGIAAYKAINTLDSMIGHMSDKYRAFGWASAITDDIVNLPASRLAAILLVGAAALNSRESASNAASIAYRVAGSHRSPNAGWPEAAMAGALGLALGGPRAYDGNTIDEPWMANGRREATPDDINAALHLFRTACMLQALLLAALSGLIWYLA